MDIATGLGIALGIGTLVGVVLVSGSGFAMYYDTLSFLLVIGGTIAATMIRYPLSVILSGLPMGLRFAFQLRSNSPIDLIDEITRVADIARKSGPVALESADVADPFLAQGLRYIADGYDKEFIRSTMERDRDNFLQRLVAGSQVYRGIGDAAPAWGMIGTVLGMILMFAQMDDPSKLGSAMAITLITTLYGALIANLIALPIADKLAVKVEEEEIARTLIIDGITQIRDAKSPTLVREMLVAYLPDHHRAVLAEA